MRRVSANKNVLSSRLNSVRQNCLAVAVQGADCSTAVVRRPQKLLSPSLDCVRGTVYGDIEYGHWIRTCITCSTAVLL